MAEHGDKERFSKSVNFEKNHVLWARDLLKKEISKSIENKCIWSHMIQRSKSQQSFSGVRSVKVSN